MSQEIDALKKEHDDLLAELRRKDAEDVARGRTCYRCGSYVSLMKLDAPGYRRLCFKCKSLEEVKGEVIHTRFIRCPKCGKSWDAHKGDDHDLLTEGEHDVTCPTCEHEFEVGVSVTYTFHSPARIEQGADPDD
jgi:NMD protein affecting ribosome stability and mRNA decay